VRSTLEGLTNGRQTSWEHTSLTGDFRFRPSVRPTVHGSGPAAIADSLAPRSVTPVGAAVEGLKTLNWYKQNDALDALSLEQIQSCSTDEAFILGRNIYQAACGGANSARSVDSEGQHREHPKLGSFEELFQLQANAEFGSSFSFIQACLAPYANHYFEIPGSGNEVTLSVSRLIAYSGACGYRFRGDVNKDSGRM
jgi:hypothetical protein